MGSICRRSYEWREDVAKRYSFWPVLLSGSLVWVGVLVLFGLGYHGARSRAAKRWRAGSAKR